MNTLHSRAITSFTIDMLRDDVKVIERRGNAAALKSTWSKMHAIIAKMPLSKDTAGDFKKTRETRGKA